MAKLLSYGDWQKHGYQSLTEQLDAEPAKKQSLVSRFVNTLKNGYNEVVKDFSVFPVHIRAFSNFVVRRTSPFTERDLTSKETVALKDMVKTAIKKGVKDSGLVDFYTIANELNNGSEQIDWSNKKNFGIDQTNIKSLYTQMAMTVGNARLTKKDKGYEVSDLYDFNNYSNNPEKYTLEKLPETMKAAFKKMGTGNFVQGVEELASYNQKLGYNGFPVKINVVV